MASALEELRRGARAARVDGSDPAGILDRLASALASDAPVRVVLAGPGADPVAAEPPGETRLLIATGGTTGGPRLAIHTWGTLFAAARGVQSWLGGGPVDSLCHLPLHHVSGLMQVVRAWASAGSVRLAPWPEIARGAFPPARPGEVTSMVPTQLARVLETPGGAAWLRGFRVVFLGGAPAWPELRARARAEGVPVAPCYGMTETAAQVTASRPEAFLAGCDDAGAALPHAQLEVRDGRIVVRARSLFLGYEGDGPRTGEGFVTGDRGALDAAGRLTVLGRADALINTGGEKVDPAAVEAALRACEGVRDVAVVGVPDARWGEAVVAIVCGLAPAAEPAIRARLHATLAPHEVPKRLVFAEALPRTAAGKPDRARLTALAAGGDCAR